MARATFTSEFKLGDRVLIDGDASIVAVVTAYAWRGERAELEICWFHNGGQQSLWIGEWRLTLAEPPK